jgi:hypothetical protein
VVTTEIQPVAIAIIEVKKESLPSGHGLDQAKGYAKAKRPNVPLVFSTNGHQFVEYDRVIGKTTLPRLMAEFPSPAELRARGFGFLQQNGCAEAARVDCQQATTREDQQDFFAGRARDQRGAAAVRSQGFYGRVVCWRSTISDGSGCGIPVGPIP